MMVLIRQAVYYETEQFKEDPEVERLNKCITMVHKSTTYKSESYICGFTHSANISSC